MQVFETGAVKMRKAYDDGDDIVKKLQKCSKFGGIYLYQYSKLYRITRIIRIAFIIAIFVIYSAGLVWLAKSSSKVTMSHNTVSCDNASLEKDSDIVQVETLHDGTVEISRKNATSLMFVDSYCFFGNLSDYRYDQETKRLTIKDNNGEESTYYLP